MGLRFVYAAEEPRHIFIEKIGMVNRNQPFTEVNHWDNIIVFDSIL